MQVEEEKLELSKCEFCRLKFIEKQHREKRELIIQKLKQLIGPKNTEKIVEVIKRDPANMCSYCFNKRVLAVALAYYRKSIKEDVFLEILDMLMTQGSLHAAKVVIGAFLEEGERLMQKGMVSDKSLARLWWAMKQLGKKAETVDEEEARTISDFYQMGFSMHELAFIFSRSPSTIHSIIHKRGATEPEESERQTPNTKH